MRSLGRYELLAPLARGGMAEVYIARRRVGGVEKRLVVKRLRRERLGDARSLDLFIREAQLSMALVQQNIVPVFDFGRVGDDVFIAMELIDGADLATSLAHTPDGPLAPAIVAHVGAECCQALAHAHRAGVVHRDVSARNVLLSRDGEVKLADFGLAVAHGDAAVVGTPRYLAPEQARGEPVDGRADLYALGMVLLEAVTGAAARPGRSVEEVLAAARSGARAELPTTLPPALAEVLRRATATAAAERFADATSMWEALDAFLVADRTRGGDAPRRQLAAWLARCALPAPAGEQRDDAWITDQARSFLDDGEDAVRGLATQRSLAATVDNPPLAARADAEVARPAAPPPAAEAPPSGGAVAAPARRRWPWLAVPAAVLSVTAAVALRGPSRRDGSAGNERPATTAATTSTAAPMPDARPVVIAPPEAPADAAPRPDARPLAAPTPDAAPPGRARADAAPRPPTHVPDARPAPVDAAPLMTRWATLGARPWAMISVDGGPAEESPVRLRLSVGVHRVRYSNPQLGVTRDIEVEVPATGELRHVETLAAPAP